MDKDKKFELEEDVEKTTDLLREFKPRITELEDMTENLDDLYEEFHASDVKVEKEQRLINNPRDEVFTRSFDEEFVNSVKEEEIAEESFPAYNFDYKEEVEDEVKEVLEPSVEESVEADVEENTEETFSNTDSTAEIVSSVSSISETTPSTEVLEEKEVEIPKKKVRKVKVYNVLALISGLFIPLLAVLLIISFNSSTLIKKNVSFIIIGLLIVFSVTCLFSIIKASKTEKLKKKINY